MSNTIRSFAAQTRNRSIFWFIIILFTLGLGLIWIFYGARAAFLGFICLIGTSIPVGLIALFLFGLEKFVDRE
jgi:polyferredoxin